MNTFEDDIRAVLQSQANAMQVPEPHFGTSFTLAPVMPQQRRPRRWRLVAAAAAVTAIVVAALVLAVSDDDPNRKLPASQPTVPVPERVGFIGLPPEGATPSESGEGVVWIRSCAPLNPLSEIDELSHQIDVLPELAELKVLADGRLIWLKYDDLPEGANSLSTGLLEQRLKPNGVELMLFEADAAISREFGPSEHRCGARDYSIFTVTPGGGYQGQDISADNEHLARVMDPWSWLPATAWQDRTIRAYVPSRYLVFIKGEGSDIPWDDLTAQLPAAAVDLIDTKYWEDDNGGPYAGFTIDEARALAAALDDAGFEQDPLLNAFVLDYQFEYQGESRDTVVHITFNVASCEIHSVGGGGLGCES
jgi:hypothetical protein